MTANLCVITVLFVRFFKEMVVKYTVHLIIGIYVFVYMAMATWSSLCIIVCMVVNVL